jgi:hypothetical protein
MTDNAPSPRFGLSLLGGFELTGPDGVVDLPSKKLAGLLAYLACTAPQPQPREKLSAMAGGHMTFAPAIRGRVADIADDGDIPGRRIGTMRPGHGGGRWHLPMLAKKFGLFTRAGSVSS